MFIYLLNPLAIWVWTALLPTLILNSKKSDRQIGYRDYLGWALWLCGMVLESISDYQKYSFRSDPANANKWISTGLWGVVRHPNYLGEILLWTGLLLSASSVFRPVDYIATLSPICIALMLVNVSGITFLERQALRRWGSDPEFQNFMASTYRLLPYIY